MSTCEITLNSYSALLDEMTEKGVSALTIANNTTAAVEPNPREFGDMGETVITVRLHGSPIVVLTEENISVSLCCWNSPTTRARIREFLPIGISLRCEKKRVFLKENFTDETREMLEGVDYVGLSLQWDEMLSEWTFQFID